MPTDVQIIPAVLATSEKEYKLKLEKISSAPEFAQGWMQIDLADGKFVPNTSVGLDILEKYPLKLQTEVHLMVEDPLDWVDRLVKIGVRRIVVHMESQNAGEALKKIRAANLEAGLALNPETPVEKIVPFVGTIDVALLMSVHPGFGGQQFIPETVEKVRRLAGILGRADFIIEVDGGITEDVASSLALAGAKNLVIGKHLTNGNIKKSFRKIQQSLRL